MKYSLLSLSFLLLMACGKAPETDGPSMRTIEPQPNLMSVDSHTYTFEDSGSWNCTTGVKKFETKEALCISLQDNEKNNNCGYTKRWNRFQSECEPLGFKWMESAQCEIFEALVAKPSLPDMSETKNNIPKKVVCAGRMEAKNFSLQAEAVDDVVLENGEKITINFKTLGNGSLEANLNLVSVDGLKSDLLIQKTNLPNTTEIPLRESGNRLRVNCQVVPACYSSNKKGTE